MDGKYSTKVLVSYNKRNAVGTVQKEILLASPGQRLNRNGFLAFAEGTNNWLNAVFGP
jgi:hypothetical protein